MKKTRSVFGILAIASALLPVCGTTTRGQTSEILESGPTVSWDIGTNLGFTGSISVPQFNPSLGVLDSVELGLTGNYQSSATVSGPDGASGQVSGIGGLVFQDSGNNFYVNVGDVW